MKRTNKTPAPTVVGLDSIARLYANANARLSTALETVALVVDFAQRQGFTESQLINASKPKKKLKK